MVDDDDDRPLLHRLVVAAVDALREGDPLLVIGIGDSEIHLGWKPEWATVLGAEPVKEQESNQSEGRLEADGG